MATKEKLWYANKCKQCYTGQKVISMLKCDQLCKDCLLRKMIYKFKAYFHKQKVSYYNKNILIIYSENAVSIALYYLLKASISENLHKHCKINFLYIYENNNERTCKDQQNIIENIINKTQDFCLEAYIASLAKYYFNKDAYIQSLNLDKLEENFENMEKFNIYLNRLYDNTSRQDLLLKLRNNLIISTAKKLNCNLVLLNDFSTDLAAEIVSNIVLGKGINAFFQNYSRGKKHSRITFLYPMQNFTQKEVNKYLQLNNLANMKLDHIHFDKYYKLSIQDITKTFICKFNTNQKDINGLDSSTICKVSEKINFYNYKIMPLAYCTLCHAAVKTVFTLESISTQFAKHFSEFISKFGRISEMSKNLFNTNNVKETESNSIFHLYRICLNKIFKDYNIFQLQESNSIVIICYACTVLLYQCNYNSKS